MYILIIIVNIIKYTLINGQGESPEMGGNSPEYFIIITLLIQIIIKKIIMVLNIY